jgi:hypothetical protein
MKTWILRASTVAFAAGLAGSLACGSSMSACGGTNLNANTGTQSSGLACGPGTYLSGTTCVVGTAPAP